MSHFTLASPDGPEPPFPPPSEPESAWRKIFMGPLGLRAGWRLLIFFAVIFAIGGGTRVVVRYIAHRAHVSAGPMGMATATGAILGEATLFAVFLLASYFMSRVEGRKVADYGLPARRIFCGQFWQGALIGFLAISFLLAMLHFAGAFSFGPMAIHGREALKFAGLWGVAFLFVGFFEEFSFRGYALFTLTTGIGFWPAAFILSALFGYVHHANPGETWLGAFSAGAFGFLFCLVLRRTGDLWMPIGLHLGWDWGETYFYGVPDSGLAAPGHLLSPAFHGPAWLTGGSVGPEASWVCIAVLVLLWLLFVVWFPDVKYPGPAAYPEPQ